MQHQNTAAHAPVKIRFLLTSACTARCGYCHNEGQAKDNTQLPLQAITHVLDTLAAGNRQVSEIILSGGEPTLHPQLAQPTGSPSACWQRSPTRVFKTPAANAPKGKRCAFCRAPAHWPWPPEKPAPASKPNRKLAKPAF